MLKSQIKAGQVIKFWYDGGSTKGWRTVTVSDVDSSHVGGATKERGGEYRSYFLNRFDEQDLHLIDNATTVLPVVQSFGVYEMKNRLSTLVHRNAVDLLTTDQICTLNDKFYSKNNGQKTVYDSATAKFNIVETETFPTKLSKVLNLGLDKVQVSGKIVSNGAELVSALKSALGL